MKVLFFSILNLFFLLGNTQNDKNTNINLSKKYTQNEIDSLISNFKVLKIELSDLEVILDKNSNFKGWVFVNSTKAENYFKKQQLDSTIYYADKAINLFENQKEKRNEDEQYLVKAYNLKGFALSKTKHYKNSILNYQKALDLINKYPSKNSTFTKVGIAENHYKLGNDSLAIKYLLLASKDSIYMKIPQSAVLIYGKIASLSYNLKNKEDAIYYARKGIKHSIRTKYTSDLSSFYGFIAIIHLDNKNKDSAFFYCKKAYDTNLKYGIPKYTGGNLTHEFYKGYINIYNNETKKGISTLSKLVQSLNLVKKKTKDDRDLMIRTLRTLAIGYEKNGDFSKYDNIMDKTFLFFNEFHRTQLKENLDNLEIQYETKEKDKSIIQLQESKIQQNTIIRQQRTINITLISLLFLSILSAVLFWKQRKLKNQYEKENLEQRLLGLQMNPHFVFNALNSVSGLVEKKSNIVIPYINKLASLFRLILTNSREEFVSLEDEVKVIDNYLSLQSNFTEDFDFEVTNNVSDEENIIIPPMLIQPFVENAVLHAFKNLENRGKIKIEINKNSRNKLLIFKISDNGIGYSKSIEFKPKQHKSVSLDIIKERLLLINKKFKTNSKFDIINSETGTVVELHLPYLID